MKIRISPANPPLEAPQIDWTLRIEAEISGILGVEQAEGWDGAGGIEPGDRHNIVFVFEVPELLPRMKRELTDLGYTYAPGDSKVWRGFEVELPPEPTAEQ
jgi:hypothetical protein